MMRRIILGALATLSLAALSSVAMALTSDEIAAKLTEAGYTVLELKNDDGLVEVKVRDTNGKVFEAYIDPATGEQVQKPSDDQSEASDQDDHDDESIDDDHDGGDDDNDGADDHGGDDGDGDHGGDDGSDGGESGGDDGGQGGGDD